MAIKSDPRLQRAGFAKLFGTDIDYLMRKYDIMLGRRSKNASPDVVLGDTLSVSRQHARIFYNFDTKRFELEVLGKHGVTVDGVLHEPSGDPVPLQSRSFVQIGATTSFYFLLPKKKSKLLRSAKKIRARSQAPPAEPSNKNNSVPGPRQENNDTDDNANESQEHPSSDVQVDVPQNPHPVAGGSTMPQAEPALFAGRAPPDPQAGAQILQRILAQQQQQQQLLRMMGQEYGERPMPSSAALHVLAAQQQQQQQMALQRMLLQQQ